MMYTLSVSAAPKGITKNVFRYILVYITVLATYLLNLASLWVHVWRAVMMIAICLWDQSHTFTESYYHST